MKLRPAVLAVLLLPAAAALAAETGRVVEVVDGDTLKVELAAGVEKVRLIGVDTPETVHPQKPVEHFGKEASAFTRSAALGKMVRLEDDQDGANRDRYNRLLRYVFLPDGRLLNAEIIAQGYGHAYTRFPFTRMEEFRALERQAREANRGLWGAPDPGAAATPAQEASPEGAADPAETVFVTRTGAKYHRAGCRSLAKSSIPIALKDAVSRYGPCAICGPPVIGGAPATVTSTPAVAPPKDEKEVTVYATRTGTKYHRAGCRYLAKSMIPLPLKEAAARYSPCSVCAPPRPGASGTPATESVPKATTPAPPPAGGRRCQAITKAGSQCKRNAAARSRYCWQHGG